MNARARSSSGQLAQPLPYAELVLALKAEQLEQLVVPGWACPAGGATGVVPVLRRAQVRCSSCVERTRRCLGCQERFPVEAFDVSAERIGSRCRPCRRAKHRERYAARKRGMKFTAARRECTDCGRSRPAREFYRHPNYAGGLMSECKQCRGARTTYYHSETDRGREVARQAAASYRKRHGRREQQAF